MRFWTGLALSLLASSVFAQSWPAKPVQVIISFTPASATDIVGRIVTAKLDDHGARILWQRPVEPRKCRGRRVAGHAGIDHFHIVSARLERRGARLSGKVRA